MSVLKGKAGFVIPKNKFSGSLVPIFNKKKSDPNDTASEEPSKHPQRKTKWASDLTQDTTVKRGRALAYQTRVDQITQQLKLGSLQKDTRASKAGGDLIGSELDTVQDELEKLQDLELEKREAIGEILKLNPSYKTPPDYQPVAREARVPVPVKAHPKFNFLGLLYGSDGETQKKLEKETGTRIQVHGKKMETGEKVEITPADRSEVLSICEEVYVQITADTYEKADAAAALIELLLSSIVVEPAASKEGTSISGDNTQALGDGQEVVQPNTGPISNFSQGLFQPYQVPWFPAGQASSPYVGAPVPSSGGLPFYPSSQRPLYGPGPPPPYVFGSSPQGTTVVPPRIHPPAPFMQGSLVAPAYTLGQMGPPRNTSSTTASSPSFNHHPSFTSSPRVAAPQLPERPPTSSVSSSGWRVPASGAPQSLASPAPPAPPLIPAQYPSLQRGPASAGSFAPLQIRSSSPVPMQTYAPQPQLNSSTNTGSAQSLLVSQFGMASPGHGHSQNFTPLQQTGVTASRPLLRGSGDFNFHPHLVQGSQSQSLPGPGAHFAPQRPSQPSLPPAPQAPSFRPAMQGTLQHPARQNFPGSTVGNQMGPLHGHLGAPNPPLGVRNNGPQFQTPAGSFSPRPGPASQFQQSQSRPVGMFVGNQHPGVSGRPQVHDPFLPSPRPHISNIGAPRKQEADPEYEDLMASVGVK